tara:strand:- start:280 stop:384 length:105 start_codon:yes stop_codon:yes gene_type:complete
MQNISIWKKQLLDIADAVLAGTMLGEEREKIKRL